MNATRKRQQCCWHQADGSPCPRVTQSRTNEYGGLPVCGDHVNDLLRTIGDELQEEATLTRREEAIRWMKVREEALMEHMEDEGCDVLRYQADQEESAARFEAEHPNFVYYMRCGAYVKIGRSTTPVNRWRAIRNLGGVRAPDGLDLTQATLDRVERGPVSLESFRHDQFQHLRVAGEWFEYGRELERFMSMKDRPGVHFPGFDRGKVSMD